ncbi:MAG TPA: hypothetical protein VFQ22_00830 [Longimicrobiales bacterium]|nr:hypothetical protein [Longimicrobiales bacterium]
MATAHHPALHLPGAWKPALRRAERIGAAALVTVLAPVLFALGIVSGLLLAMALAYLM